MESKIVKSVVDRQEPSDDFTYPEGGFNAWSVVFGAFCILMSVFGVINSSAVFESYFRQHQLKDKTDAEISWIFSLYLFTVYFVGILAGPVFDRFGHRVLLASGGLLTAISPTLLSLSSEYYQIILTFSVMSGIGGALINSPGLGAISHYFNKRRGLAMGIATTAGSIGGIIFPFILQATLPTIGFAWSMRILGFILLLLAILFNIFVDTRVPPSSRSQSIWPDIQVFRDPKFSLCCAGIFFMEYGVLIPLTYIVSYATSHGQDLEKTYKLPAILNAGSVLGRIIPGLLSDKIGRFNVLILTVGSCMLSVFVLWLPAGNSEPLLIIFTLVLGFTSGGNVSLIPVCIGQLCEVRDYGRYLSTAMIAASFGTLTGIPIGGAILGSKGSHGWEGLILFSGLSYAASVLCYVGARVLAVGWNPKTWY